MIKKISLFLVGFVIGFSVLANEVPKNFLFHKDTLIKVMKTSWDDITIPSVIPGLIEQETCYSLKDPRCWSRFAKLETSREYGFGLGQLTVTKRFNAFEEVKTLDQRLKDWKWEDRFDAEYQMIAIVAMLRRNYMVFRSAKDDLDRYAFALAAYNGGVGGILSDQSICRNTKGCNPDLWFGNVENTSLKKKTAVSGYGQSFFEINRKYPVSILKVRRFKYKPYVDPFFKAVQ